MSTNLTVFVIGAGASAEFGLPVGERLTTLIAQSTDFNESTMPDRYRQAIVNLSANQHIEFQQLVTASNQLSRAMPQAQSIDNYLDVHRSNPNVIACGKVAIVSEILEAERRSELHISRDTGGVLPFAKLRGSYLNSLFQKICEQCPWNELPVRLQSIAFLIFNYDRCIEQFLYWSFINYYKIDGEASRRLMSYIRFIHPYGSIGPLPELSDPTGVAFGDSMDSNRLLLQSRLIRTFTEETNSYSRELTDVRSLTGRSDRLVFLDSPITL